jgi:hypothetical protein
VVPALYNAYANSTKYAASADNTKRPPEQEEAFSIIAWQGWQDVNRTFEDEAKVNVEEIRELLDEDRENETEANS